MVEAPVQLAVAVINQLRRADLNAGEVSYVLGVAWGLLQRTADREAVGEALRANFWAGLDAGEEAVEEAWSE